MDTACTYFYKFISNRQYSLTNIIVEHQAAEDMAKISLLVMRPVTFLL